MIARFHGRLLTVDQLRERLRPGEQGVSLMELHRLAEGVGMPCTAVHIDPQQWSQVRLPALVHWKEGHFVVLFHREATGVRVGDPATGLLTQTLGSFRERCSGRASCSHRRSTCQSHRSTSARRKRPSLLSFPHVV